MNRKFPFSCRLHHSHEFDLVFRSSKLATKWFTLYYSANVNSVPRLGMVVSKKLIQSAVIRNKIKRVTRECFRNTVSNLASIDFVIRLNKTIKNKADSDDFSRTLSHKLETFKQIRNDQVTSS